MSVGSASAMPVTSVDTSCTAASMSSGRFSISVFTMVIRACTAAGINCGRSERSVSSTWENSSVTDFSSVGSSSPTAVSSASSTVGSAAMMFSMTGVIFSTTVLNASTMLPHSSSMSALASPNPTMRLDTADFSALTEPDMVASASLAVVPAMSMLSCMTWMASTTSA